MAFGGGTYTKYDKFMPGTYINTITVGAPQPTATNGTVAVGLKMDWGPDNEIFEFTATDFQENSESITGYSYGDDKNFALRELFRHANRLVAYKLNSGGSERAKNVDVGNARYTGKVGNNITVSCYKNVNDTDKYDVTTYYDGVLKDTQTVEKSQVNKAMLTKGVKTDNPDKGDPTQDTTVEFTIDNDDKLIAKVSNIPEHYKVYPRFRDTDDRIIAIGEGIIESSQTEDTITIAFGTKCPQEEIKVEIVAQEYCDPAVIDSRTLSAILSDTPDDDPDYENPDEFSLVSGEKVLLSTQNVTVAIKEAVQSGADVTLLDDNDFVIFKEEGVIEENAGYAFTGGTSSETVNAGSYTNLLNALESRTFDVFVYDGDDRGVKALVTAYTKRMRDERGKYFQSVLYNYPEADYEGVISVFNKVTSDNKEVQKSSLTLWYAGYSSAIDLSNEITSKLYDGELTVDTSTPDSQLEILVKQGNVVFHRVSDTEVFTLFDVNTLTSYTKEKDSQLSENKVVRIIDYLHNTEAYYLNRNDIGRTPNTTEGRALIWNECYDILSNLQNSGAIAEFSPENLSVDPVETDKHAVKINQTFTVTGTIYRIYITTYVVQ